MLQISPRDSLGGEPRAQEDKTHFWRVTRHGDLDFFTATFRKHVFPPHTHETYVIGVTLDCDSLSPAPGEADTYLKMLRHDVSVLRAGMMAN